MLHKLAMLYRTYIKGKTEGIVYLDALIAIVILSVAFAGIAAAYQYSTRNVVYANDSTYATFLAKQALEEVKKNDRLIQKSDNSIAVELINPEPIKANGVTYTVILSKINISEQLGNISSLIYPVQATVSWYDRINKQDKSITLVQYFYFQPFIPDPPSDPEDPDDPDDPKPTPTLPKNTYYFYQDMDTARDNNTVDGYADSGSAKGYFYTPASKQYKLWDSIFGDQWNITGPGYTNYAVTNAWGGSGDVLRFENILFPKLTTGEYIGFKFRAKNDAAAGEEAADGTFRDPLQWGLSEEDKKKKQFVLDFAIDDKVLIKNILVKADDVSFNFPYYGTFTEGGTKYATTYNTQKISYISDGKTVNYSVTAEIVDGTIRIFNMPPGIHAISLKWINDTGDVSKPGTHGAAGSDANILIANMSLAVYNSK